MPTNYLTEFAFEEANLPSEASWAASDDRSTGFVSGVASSERMNRAIAQGCVAGHVLGRFVAEKTTRDGNLDYGSMYSGFLEALKAQLLESVYPVGSLYMSTRPTSPATVLGGTWVLYGQGRTLVSQNANYPAGSTGGAEKVTLESGNIPAHTHTATASTVGGHTHGGTVASGGSHQHTATTSSGGSHTHNRGTMNITGQIGWHVYPDTPSGAFSLANIGEKRKGGNSDSTSPGSKVNFSAANSWTGVTGSSGEHSHSLTTAAGGAHAHTLTVDEAGSHTHTITVGSTGGEATPVDVRQPWISVYIWQRTA